MVRKTRHKLAQECARSFPTWGYCRGLNNYQYYSGLPECSYRRIYPKAYSNYEGPYLYLGLYIELPLSIPISTAGLAPHCDLGRVFTPDFVEALKNVARRTRRVEGFGVSVGVHSKRHVKASGRRRPIAFYSRDMEDSSTMQGSVP